MVSLAFALLALAALLSFLDWRRGLALCVLMAIIQDPLRKLVPGEPVYFIVFVGVVFAAAWLGAFMSRVPLNPNAIHGWSRFVGAPYGVLMLLVALQAIHSYGRWGAPIMTALGLVFFLAPTLAVVFAYQYAVRRGTAGIIAWLTLYIAIAGFALVSVYLEYSGYDWAILGEVGVGIVIYDISRALEAFSGTFRGAEIAAWHAGTAACMSFLVLLWHRRTMPRWLLALAAVAFMVAIGMLTGRRKMLVVVALFLFAYFGFSLWFQNRLKVAVIVALAGVSAYVGLVGMGDETGPVEEGTRTAKVADDELYKAYSIRGTSVIEDIPDRFAKLGLKPIEWATNRFGYFGAGLGVATQGAQQFGPRSLKRGGAGEGGLGKLTVELGVAGLVVALWLALAFARYVARVLKVLSAASPRHARLGYGLTGLLLANFASFSVATQAYGDIFILLFLGITAGFLLALPVVAGKELAEDQAAAEAEASRRAAALAQAAEAAQPA